MEYLGMVVVIGGAIACSVLISAILGGRPFRVTRQAPRKSK